MSPLESGVLQAPAASDRRPPALPHCLSWWQAGLKRGLDVLGALLFFALFGPLYLLVAIAVWGAMGRPIHYWQLRVGEGGRPFCFYKFRSMSHGADETLAAHLRTNPEARHRWERFQKLAHDPRITPVGRLLRRLSLDELPQFWNVLKGDMSLVGPRPCMVRQRSLYGDRWRHYCAMRPGITGLWQVSGRNRLSYAERVALDARYATEWSLRLDLKILARTLVAVAAGEGCS